MTFQKPRTPWRTIFFCCVVVVIVIYGWCRWTPWWCPFCPPAPAPAATIVLEDTHASAWMVADNSWIGKSGKPLGKMGICDPTGNPSTSFGECSGNYDTRFRHGAMFQLGSVKIPADPVAGVERYFKDIRLTHPDGTTTTLTPDLEGMAFDWIDINPHGGKCSIDALHAYMLFQNKLVSLSCDSATTSTTANMECLRQRNIHASYQSDIGVVTYWSGDDFFEVEALDTYDPQSVNHEHVAYTFALNDAVDVDVWKKGCFQQRFERVKEIRIRYINIADDHTPFHIKPIDGGDL